MPETEDKVRENRLRRMAKRQGYQVCKSRRRDPRAIDYGLYYIFDPRTNTIVGGYGFNMTLDDVEKWLTSDD